VSTIPPVPGSEPEHPADTTSPEAPAAPHAMPQDETTPATGEAASTGSRPTWVLPVVTGVAGLVIGAALMSAIGGARASAAQSAVLSDAVDACGVAATVGIDLADEGRSITFDMKGEEDTYGADITDIACLFGALDMPSAVMSHIDQTTSMDGRQTETWDNITVSWSYHPDRGLDGVLTVSND